MHRNIEPLRQIFLNKPRFFLGLPAFLDFQYELRALEKIQTDAFLFPLHPLLSHFYLPFFLLYSFHFFTE